MKSETEKKKKERGRVSGLATRSGDETGEGFPVRIFFGEICIFRWPLEGVCPKTNKPESEKERITESENGYGDF